MSACGGAYIDPMPRSRLPALSVLRAWRTPRQATALGALVLGASLTACPSPDPGGDPTPAPDLDLLAPAAGAMTGYFPVVIDTGSVPATEVREVWVGGVLALDRIPLDSSHLSVLVQGRDRPGEARVDLVTEAGTSALGQRFTYTAPIDPAFDRVVAFGASLTQGVMDGTPTHDGVMQSPALMVARSMGAYLPQPVLIPGLFPTLGLDSVGPAPECASQSVVQFIQGAITEVLGELVVPGEGFAYWVGRSDPDITVRNLAAGNFMVDDMLYGPEVGEIVQNFLGPLSLDPYADFAAGPRWTMIEALERLEPTVVVSFDMMGNDVLNNTPIEEMEANVPPLVERLAATGAEVFLADMPDPAILEGSLGDDPFGDEQSQLAEACNDVLRAEAERYANVHVVPVAARARVFAEDGFASGGQELTADMLGGILSFDGLHFSPTGYAIVADLFVETINATLGTDLPAIDIEAVLAGDPHSPASVLAAGRDPLECRP